MRLKKNIAILALAITLFLFISVIFLGIILNNKREDKINAEVKKMYDDFRGMEMLSLIIENYDNDMICIAFESKLKDLDSYIWKLGEDIDKYRIATEEFQKDEYFLTQKKEFNENEVFYYLMMKKMITQCNIKKEPMLFFYQNSADCKKCDDLSFVLNDINEMDDKQGKNEISIFSFDIDLNITSINILNQYYKINQYPCIAFSDNKILCGMQDKEVIIDKICSINPNISIC
jgi:hypothetical protein